MEEGPLAILPLSNQKTSVIWSVKNIKTDKNYDLLEDVIRIHQENGWILERHYSIGKNTRNVVNAKGDTTYVFSKE